MSNIVLTQRDQIRKANRKAQQLEANVKLVKESSEEDVRIEELIRERYSLSQELAIHRKLLVGVYTANSPEVVEYNSYVVDCINQARTENAPSE